MIRCHVQHPVISASVTNLNRAHTLFDPYCMQHTIASMRQLHVHTTCAFLTTTILHHGGTWKYIHCDVLKNRTPTKTNANPADLNAFHAIALSDDVVPLLTISLHVLVRPAVKLGLVAAYGERRVRQVHVNHWWRLEHSA